MRTQTKQVVFFLRALLLVVGVMNIGLARADTLRLAESQKAVLKCAKSSNCQPLTTGNYTLQIKLSKAVVAPLLLPLLQGTIDDLKQTTLQLAMGTFTFTNRLGGADKSQTSKSAVQGTWVQKHSVCLREVAGTCKKLKQLVDGTVKISLSAKTGGLITVTGNSDGTYGQKIYASLCQQHKSGAVVDSVVVGIGATALVAPVNVQCTVKETTKTIDTNTFTLVNMGIKAKLPALAVFTPQVDSRISGFAATGVAVPAGSPVAASCVSGQVSNKVTENGAYSLPTLGFVFPCLLRATYGSGESQQMLYSLATAAGTVHITPLTHAMVLQAAGADLAALFATPSQAGLDALVAKVPDLQTTLRQLLTDLGLASDLAQVPGDFFTAPLVPGNATALGNVHDLLLDAVIKRFGVLDALVAELGTAFFEDKGFAARVDWSKCRDKPRSMADGSGVFVASQCRSKAVVLSRAPSRYYNNGSPASARVMNLSTLDPIQIGGECLLSLTYNEFSNPPPEQRPIWTGSSGPVIYLRSWSATVYIQNPTGPGLVARENGYGDFDLSEGAVYAIGDDAGAQVVQITAGGFGSLFFKRQPYISKVTLKFGSECLWF